MGKIRLFRHGQAGGFLLGTYSSLTDLGKKQASALAEQFVREGSKCDRLVSGPAPRHQESLALLGESGLAWPAAETLPALDEYAGHHVFSAGLPEAAKRRGELGALAKSVLDNFQSAGNDESKIDRRAMLTAYNQIVMAWAEGSLELNDIDPWETFIGRASQSLAELTQKDGTVVAITSAGVMGAMVASVLNLRATQALELSWALYNTAGVELRFSRGRMALARFNDTGHLPANLLTFV